MGGGVPSPPTFNSQTLLGARENLGSPADRQFNTTPSPRSRELDFRVFISGLSTIYSHGHLVLKVLT